MKNKKKEFCIVEIMKKYTHFYVQNGIKIYYSRKKNKTDIVYCWEKKYINVLYACLKTPKSVFLSTTQ